MEPRVNHLSLLGFVQSIHDRYLFTRRTDSSFIALLVYVDDILLTGSLESDLTLVKQSLHFKFTIKDLKLAKYFLGLEIAHASEGTLIDQHRYILDILRTLVCLPPLLV